VNLGRDTVNLNLTINKVPMTLGEKLPAAMLDEAAFHRNGFLLRLLSRDPLNQTIYSVENCELIGFDEELRIYPCTDGYLNPDRQWSTKATLFLKNDRLQRILFQVVDGQTAAMNFISRFEKAIADKHGEPCHKERRSRCWQDEIARVKTYLHPNRVNADFIIELNH
jgi:hypothetical protein